MGPVLFDTSGEWTLYVVVGARKQSERLRHSRSASRRHFTKNMTEQVVKKKWTRSNCKKISKIPVDSIGKRVRKIS